MSTKLSPCWANKLLTLIKFLIRHFSSLKDMKKLTFKRWYFFFKNGRKDTRWGASALLDPIFSSNWKNCRKRGPYSPKRMTGTAMCHTSSWMSKWRSLQLNFTEYSLVFDVMLWLLSKGYNQYAWLRDLSSETLTHPYRQGIFRQKILCERKVCSKAFGRKNIPI